MQTRERLHEHDFAQPARDQMGVQQASSAHADVDDVSQAVATQRRMSAIANGGPRLDQQRAAASAAQRKADQDGPPNRTGLPDQLKTGIESLSGVSMDGVKVHYNSAQPAQLDAHAYAQGTEIHVAPGQEQHLPHEAWHLVQQAQGRVQPTMQLANGVAVNADVALEAEADAMGAKALNQRSD